MLKPIYISEGMRILGRSLYAKRHGTFKYPGNAEEICKRIIDDCWNKRKNYFQASNGHFSEFYVRDFAFCAEALMDLGYEDKVRQTLEYALKIFSRSRKITTTISPGGYAFDFTCYSSDSLPLLIRALKLADAEDIFRNHSTLFVNEVKRYYDNVFDPTTGMVKKKRHFSAISDWIKKNSSTYDNCMLAMLREDLIELKFYNPFQESNIKKRIKEELWNGKYFFDDMDKKENVVGDANVFPFWTGLFTSREMAKSCINYIQKAKLDRPFPLKYTAERKGRKFIILNKFAQNYEGTSIWPHLGLCFMDIAKKYSKADFNGYMEKYSKVIEENKNMLEVFDEDGKPFKRMLYYSDEGMLWAAKYLGLSRQ